MAATKKDILITGLETEISTLKIEYNRLIKLSGMFNRLKEIKLKLNKLEIDLGKIINSDQ